MCKGCFYRPSLFCDYTTTTTTTTNNNNNNNNNKDEQLPLGLIISDKTIRTYAHTTLHYTHTHTHTHTHTISDIHTHRHNLRNSGLLNLTALQLNIL